jgi:N-carbamoylputrescine amidase
VRIALIQQRATEDRKSNTERGVKALEQAVRQGAQLVCYAELSFEPFYPQGRPKSKVTTLAETIPGPTTDIFTSLASKHRVVVVLNLFECDGDKTYDTSPVINAKGHILGKTRMVHIPDYTFFHEKNYYTPGNLGAPVYETKYGKIGIAICYDRHFPEYMRALALSGAEIVLVPQAGVIDEWPEGLFEAEMQVASFQNGFFVGLCNRVGKEHKLEFAGESFVCSPDGRVIAQAGKGTEEILMCDIDVEMVKHAHARKLFLPDRRPELYNKWFGS